MVTTVAKYIMRLDDACEKRNIKNWDRMEKLLDKYKVKPLVGVIPHCEDPMMDQYRVDPDFWSRVNTWKEKGWVPALHGYNHVYGTNEGGINPVNKRSEFAGESLEIQCDKIRKGISIMRNHGVNPKVFFAPSHTFDTNTIEALKKESDIFIISDTIASKAYSMYGITFVPQQSGSVRVLPLKMVTFCYHPNTMTDSSFDKLEEFLQKYKQKFIPFPVKQVKNKKTLNDKILSWMYFSKRRG